MADMSHRQGRLQRPDGTDLYWQAWLPAGEPTALVVLAHGAGEHSGRYRELGARLTEAGYALHAVDHRGHGRSSGARMYFDSLDDVLDDLDAFIGQARAGHAGRPTVLLGHSMGGLVALGHATRNRNDIDALALSSPLAALPGDSPPKRMAVRVLSRLAPHLGIVAVDPRLVSRDSTVVRAYVDDPLNFHGRLPARTIAEMARAIDRLPTTVPTLRVPLLVMLGTVDGLAPPEGGRMVHERAGSADRALRVYEGLYHEIFNEPEKSSVMDDLVAWLDERCQRASTRVAAVVT